ncbi:hypothetical protein V6N13_069734 [Hibiscus sabdariffa]|uniref:Uncharacterized protein n=1 Tax=Hibiscus sabdariffa TaxID=183260 RepID=A0ABR2PH44_9ROSI
MKVRYTARDYTFDQTFSWNPTSQHKLVLLFSKVLFMEAKRVLELNKQYCLNIGIMLEVISCCCNQEGL